MQGGTVGPAYDGLGFEEFRALAMRHDLNMHERIGFTASDREGLATVIFADMSAKLALSRRKGLRVCDIGCGCGELATTLIEACGTLGHTLHLIDSAEMLDPLPSRTGVFKLPGRFPMEFDLASLEGQFDAVVSYSVLQYIFAEGNVIDFVDAASRLLAPGGRLLIGDIPNISMRKRYFSSASGRERHARFTGTTEPPIVEFNVQERGRIDDSVIMGILMRARSAGFDAFSIPQADELPFSTRREDLLIVRP